jgi:two-component system, cell cycle response regulator
VLFVEALEGLAPQYNNLWQPWLGAFSGGSLADLPGPRRPRQLRAAAAAPQRRADRLPELRQRDAGALHARYAPDFLQHLADIAAVCLENAVNRSRLVRSGITDVLTGLYNRRYLQHRLVDELARARRDGGRWPA